MIRQQNSNSMEGIHYVTDEHNERVAVQIDLKRYHSIWEDFYDRLLVESRANEEAVSLDDFVKELNAERLLDDEA